jgi:hypothetical protein
MSVPNDNPQTPRPNWRPEGELLEADINAALLVVRPGDALFVMPIAGDHWTHPVMERIAEIVKERLPEARIVVLPSAATFATVAVEDAHQP